MFCPFSIAILSVARHRFEHFHLFHIHWSRISLICVLIMIWIGCRNVSVNIHNVHGSLLSIHGSCYVDRVNFEYVIVNDMNKTYSLLSSQKLFKTTWTGSRMCRWEGWIYFKMQFAGNVTVRLQVEVKDQNMVKLPLGIYHSISTLYADPMMNSVALCISYGKFPRDAWPCFDS